jgi:type IV secretion system protein VirD4
MIGIISMIFEVIFQVISELFDGFFEFTATILAQERKTEYTADFEDVSVHLGTSNTGFCLDGKNSTDISISHRGALIIGGSGSGKTTSILLPTIYNAIKGNTSIIINDPSLELIAKSGSYLKSKGYEVLNINWNSKNSNCFNPIHRCKTISDIQKISQTIIDNALGSSIDIFWNRSAQGLINLMIRYLKFHTEEKYHTMSNVLNLLNSFIGNPTAVDRLFVYAHDPILLAEYKSYVGIGEKTLGSIIATCKSALNIWNDEIVSLITSHDNIDFKKFRHNKIALFLNSSTTSMKYHSTISAIFFSQFFDEILSKLPNENENNILFLLDEASSFYLPELPLVVANCRKYSTGVMLVFQDTMIMDSMYGTNEAHNIRANCFSKVYLPGQPNITCRELEQTLGKFEYADKDGKRQIRSLLLADEIRQTDKALILLGNLAPIHTKLYPFYKNEKLLSYSNLPMINLTNELPFSLPPILPLHEERKEK